MTEKAKIGLEVHIQIKTKSKLFCSCPSGKSENNVCPICLGMPGALPTPNKKAIEYAIRLALALNCELAEKIIFWRKCYFYPDLPKNFQITQLEPPLAKNGKLKIGKKIIYIRELHLEEDPASITYPADIHSSRYCIVDHSRSGTPLIELVTEPCFDSAKQCRLFLTKLVAILKCLKIFDESCVLRVDANVSLNGPRVEIKNIGSIKEVERAINYEIIRQKHFAKLGKLKRETRLWDSTSKTTKPMREKETEEEYGYIVEPNISVIEITKEFIEKIKKELPELPDQKAERLIKQYKIKPEFAEILSLDYDLCEIFENIATDISPNLAASFLCTEVAGALNYEELEAKAILDRTEEIKELLEMVEKNKITRKAAKKIVEKLISKKFSVKQFVSTQDMYLVSDEKKLEEICKKVVKENKKAVEDYKNGKEKVLQFFIGTVMKMTNFSADPQLVRKIILRLIENSAN